MLRGRFLLRSLPFGVVGAIAAGHVKERNILCDQNKKSYENMRPSDVMNFPEFVAGLEKRRKSAKAVEEAKLKVQSDFLRLDADFQRHNLSQEQFVTRVNLLRIQFKEEISLLTFGSKEDGARHEEYLQRFGCSRPSSDAINAVSEFSPLIEIGAGAGHWAKKLRETAIEEGKGEKKAGGGGGGGGYLRAAFGLGGGGKKNDKDENLVPVVDILAFDDYSSLPLPHPPVTEVLPGNESKVKEFPNRTLLLVFPPPSHMAYNCTKMYTGRYLLYVGEGRGGANASDEFFDEIDARWEVERVVDVIPFKENYEKLYVLRRKGK